MVDVVCGVIWSTDGRYLLARRPEGRIWSGFWEFPGGKIEPHEEAEAALSRELREELGITAIRTDPWLLKVFEYPHAVVRLHFFHVREWSGTPNGLEGQALHWQLPSAPCGVEPLLPANTPVLRSLMMPSYFPVTPPEAVAHREALTVVSAGLTRRASATLRTAAGETSTPLVEGHLQENRGVMEFAVNAPYARDADDPSPSGECWLQIRRGHLTACEWRDWSALCADFSVLPVANTSVEEAVALGATALHLNATRLAALKTRPGFDLVGASVHSREEMAHAESLGLNYVILGNVMQTPSHPGRAGLGWKAWADIARWAQLPVYAIGGLAARHLDVAHRHGASGIAMIGAAWQTV
jgi:8-oxo-dGTP diphosphatase